MKVLNNINECIEYSKCSINQYSNLNEIIEPSDYENWTNKLNSSSDFQAILIGENLKPNILNTSVLLGLSIKKSLYGELFDHYKMLLKKTNSYLGFFPELKTNKKFKAKLKNL